MKFCTVSITLVVALPSSGCIENVSDFRLEWNDSIGALSKVCPAKGHTFDNASFFCPLIISVRRVN